ncbi:hypothetical protein CsSME_00032491 [Camellia sinensis var. sinensis]
MEPWLDDLADDLQSMSFNTTATDIHRSTSSGSETTWTAASSSVSHLGPAIAAAAAKPHTPSGVISAAIAHVFALFVAVSIGANISGGHVNPAVTFGAFIGEGLPLDLHLAKRYYDQALEIDPAAKLPVTLALASLWVRNHSLSA